MNCLGNPKTAGRLIRKEADRQAKEKSDAMLDICNNLYTACNDLVLLDKFGFSLEDVEKFNNDTRYLFDSINQGYIDFDCILETLEKEYGLTFVFNNKEKK